MDTQSAEAAGADACRIIRTDAQIGFNDAMTPTQIWLLAKEAVSSWSDDYAPSMGAALAYYTLFSIAPLLLIVIALAGLVFGEEAARGQIFGELQSLMGTQGAAAVQALLANVNQPSKGVFAAVVGMAALVLGAMSVFGELQNALDRIWRAPVRPGGANLLNLLRARLLSFGMILGIGFLLIVSLLASAGLAALGKWWAPAFGEWTGIAEALNFVLTFATVTASFALIYKVVPRVRVEWPDVWIGAAVTALLFTVGKFAIGFYIGTASFASGFGAAASLVVILVWMYYSAQIFLLGAEFTWVYAHTLGSLRNAPGGRASPAVPSRSGDDAAQAVAASRSAVGAALDASGGGSGHGPA
jgi:membrane protein